MEIEKVVNLLIGMTTAVISLVALIKTIKVKINLNVNITENKKPTSNRKRRKRR